MLKKLKKVTNVEQIQTWKLANAIYNYIKFLIKFEKYKILIKHKYVKIILLLEILLYKLFL